MTDMPNLTAVVNERVSQSMVGRVCEECQEVKPLIEFKIRADEKLDINKFRHTCHDCRDVIDEVQAAQHARNLRTKATRAKQEQLIQKAGSVLSNAIRHHTPTVEDLTASVFGHLGGEDDPMVGMKRLSAMIANNATVAVEERAGSPAATAALRLITTLMVDREKMQESKDPLRELTDEELQQAHEELVQARIEEEVRKRLAAVEQPAPLIEESGIDEAADLSEMTDEELEALQ